MNLLLTFIFFIYYHLMSLSSLGIDWSHWSGKDTAVQMLQDICPDTVALHAGGVKRTDDWEITFSLANLREQYRKSREYIWDNKVVIHNRTILSYLVGTVKSAPRTTLSHSLATLKDRFERKIQKLLQDGTVFLDDQHIVLIRDPSIMLGALEARINLGEASGYDAFLYKNPRLVIFQQELLTLLWDIVKANIIYNDWTKDMLFKKLKEALIKQS